MDCDEIINIKHFAQLITDSSMWNNNYEEEYNFRNKLINDENYCMWAKLVDKIKYEEEFYESLFSGEIGDFIFKNYTDVISVNPLGFNDVLLFDDVRIHLSREFIELCEGEKYYPFYELIYANRTTKILSLDDIKQNNRDHLIRVKNKINTQLAYEKRVLSRNCTNKIQYVKMNIKTVAKLLNVTQEDVLKKVHSDILNNFVTNKNYIQDKMDGILLDKKIDDIDWSIMFLKMSTIFEVLGTSEDIDSDGYVDVVIKFTNVGYTEKLEETIFNEIDKMELIPIVEKETKEIFVRKSKKSTKNKKIKYETRNIKSFILMYSSEVEKKVTDMIDDK